MKSTLYLRFHHCSFVTHEYYTNEGLLHRKNAPATIKRFHFDIKEGSRPYFVHLDYYEEGLLIRFRDDYEIILRDS